MVQKFYAIKSEKDINKGTIISTIFALVVAGGCYFLGGFGRLFTDKLTIDASGAIEGGFDAIVPTMLSGLPDILIAIVIILVLSASMSTLSSLVLASSSTLTLDMLKGHVIKNMSEKKQVLVMRILIVVFIAISAFIAINKDKLSAILYGHIIDRDLRDTVDKINAVDGLVVSDLQLKLDGELKSTALLTVELDLGKREIAYNKIMEIAEEKDFLVIDEV